MSRNRGRRDAAPPKEKEGAGAQVEKRGRDVADDAPALPPLHELHATIAVSRLGCGGSVKPLSSGIGLNLPTIRRDGRVRDQAAVGDQSGPASRACDETP